MVLYKKYGDGLEYKHLLCIGIEFKGTYLED